jgi:hypothetical protein
VTGLLLGDESSGSTREENMFVICIFYSNDDDIHDVEGI